MLRQMFWERFSILLVAILLFGAIGSYADTERIAGDGSGPPFRLLFVGNSIFFTNGGVNHVVAKLLQQHFPRVAIEASQVAEPNFLLRQHLEKAWRPGTHQYEALGINSTENWDFVIFQEESRQIAMGGEAAASSVEALKALTWLAHARGARVGVVQTWAWIDGRSKLWPTFEAMQDQINNLTAGYMQAERQQEENVFLAPVGLGYEFVHDVVDLADFAHGQDRGAPVAERMLALVGNPYASILRLCDSKRNMMDTALATSDSSPAIASTAADADASDTARAFADSAWTAGQDVPGDATSDSTFGQTDSSASSRTARWNSNEKNSMESVESNKDALKADLQIESDVSKVAPSAIVGRAASSAWQQEQLHLKTKGYGQKRSDLNVCQASNLPAGNNTFMDLYWDELHPSREGTYLQGLIIASAMTGCRMAGVAYGFDLEPAWVPFLQSLSDAIVFYGTPKQYPSYSWATSGRSCVLGKSG